MTTPATNAARTRDTVVLALLTAGVGAIAAGMVHLGLSTPLEAVGVATGAVCVWLVVRENVWNFPIGMVNVAAFSFLFFDAGLFADAGLQIVYFGLNVVGWWLWLRGGDRGSALRINRVGRREATALMAGGLTLVIVLWLTLRHVGGSASFFDALTTTLSLCAQWLLNRKRVENWYLWIAADLVYIPLYAYKGLYLTSGLYTVFLVMATMGLFHWRASWRAAQSLDATPSAPASLVR